MIKLIGAVLILFAGTMIGWQQAAGYSARPRQIRQLIQALQRLETEINYGYTLLPEAIGRSGIQLPEPVCAILRDASDLSSSAEGRPFAECWEQAVKSNWPATAMKNNEQSALLRLGSTLGISDREDQVKHLQLAVQQLRAEEDAAREEQARYEKMSRSLGVLVAVLVVILIV
ncbi:stage III sporulation protein SpoIIIAB [Paenibacillus sp. GCM10027626]|uniref:stage III sporulation protein SpoIIIAB n=1 Tax=Paenibacillus sp. GCM10027626 TaxID=3273411 RepID=UPI00363BE1FA